ncbi:hypothetical protein BH09MYX1_BH09MYX1_53320 [soil metagenome]
MLADEARFRDAVACFNVWAGTVPEDRRSGEWECNYGAWGEIQQAWKALLGVLPVARFSSDLVHDAIYAIARDNECQWLARDLSQVGTDGVRLLTEAALASSPGEPDAKWQLAVELGKCSLAEVEPLLLRLAVDADEYVRRRTLGTLARLGSPHVHALAEQAWESAATDMPWTKMNVLWVLPRVGSPRLEARLVEAEASTDELLRGYAARVRSGTADP